MNLKKGLKRIHKVIIILSILLGLIFYYQDYENRKSDLAYNELQLEIIEKEYNKISVRPLDFSIKSQVKKQLEFLNLALKYDEGGYILEPLRKELEYINEYNAQERVCSFLRLELGKPNTALIYKYSVIISLIVIVPYLLFFLHKFILFRVTNYFIDGFKSSNETNKVKTSDSKNNSGLSVENPIAVSSIVEEYQYLENYYSGYELIQQSALSHNGTDLDCMMIKLKDGNELKLYFDISSFYGDENKSLEQLDSLIKDLNK